MWHEPDPARRRAVVAGLWAEDAENYTSRFAARGLEEIVARVARAHDEWVAAKGFIFRPAAYIVRIVHVIPVTPFATGGIGRLVLTPDTDRVQIPDGVLQPGEHYYFQVIAVASSQPRGRGQLEILFVPPRAQLVDALSGTIRVE